MPFRKEDTNLCVLYRPSNDDNSPWKQNVGSRKQSNSVMQNQTIQWAGEQH